MISKCERTSNRSIIVVSSSRQGVLESKKEHCVTAFREVIRVEKCPTVWIQQRQRWLDRDGCERVGPRFEETLPDHVSSGVGEKR